MSPNQSVPTLIRGFTCLQTDDTAVVGNSSFVARESKMASRFDCRPSTVLNEWEQLIVISEDIGLFKNVYSISQPDHVEKLKKMAEDCVDKSDFVTQHADGAYIVAVGRPDLTCGFAHASQIVHLDEAAAISLDTQTQRTKETREHSFHFAPLDAS